MEMVDETNKTNMRDDSSTFYMEAVYAYSQWVARFLFF
jgi:hypothetical protein